MITIFILKSGEKKANEEKLKESFGDIEVENFINIQRISQIDFKAINTKWFMILFDNEFLAESLRKSLAVYLTQDGYDLFVIMKRSYGNDGELKVTEAPRMFRNYITLERDSLMPIEPEGKTSTRILDGWILDDKSIHAV